MPVKFQRKVVKIGGSYRITIPLEIVQALNIQEGNILNIWINNNQIVMEKSINE